MKTLKEVQYAFVDLKSPVKLDAGGGMRLLKLNVAFANLAYDLVDLVPESLGREDALKDLFQVRALAAEAVVEHHSVEKPKEKKDVRKNKAR